MHELAITVRPFEGTPYTLERSQYYAKVDYIRASEGTGENIVTIANVFIPPRSEVVVTIGIAKYLREWERYPNDPSRGFNIMQMPVHFRDTSSETWQSLESAPLLVQIPEPDFSMPFNVNAATNAVLGVFMINMYYVLVKAKRFTK